MSPLPHPCPGTAPRCCPAFGDDAQAFPTGSLCNCVLLAVILAAHQHMMVILAPDLHSARPRQLLQDSELLEAPSQFLVQRVRPCKTTTPLLSKSCCWLGQELGPRLCCTAVTRETWTINLDVKGRV